MNENWQTYKLGEVLEIRYGKDHKHLEDGNIPVYGSGGIMRYANNFLCDKPSILIPRKGTLSNLFFVEQPFWSVDTMFYTKINEGNNPKFIYYYLKTLNLAALNVGSAVPSLTTEVLNKVEIQLPNLENQNQIVEILSSLDDKIELNNQMNQTLESMAQAIFKEWFVDFRFPGFDGELVDGLPKCWRMGKVGEEYKTTSGGTPSRKIADYYIGGTINWVKSKELKGSFIFETEEKITQEALKNSSAKLLPEHTVLIAMYGATVGEFAITGEITTCNQAICAVIEKNDLPYTYFFEFLKYNKNKIIGLASGSAQQNISQLIVQNLDIIVPEHSVIMLFKSTVSNIYSKIEDNKRQIKILENLRNILLPKLMSGKININ